MAVWIDKKYLNLLSPQLQLFKWKKDNVANHRCPICGDSKKNKLKARGYHFVKKGGLFYKCHNCSSGMAFSTFLKKIDMQLYEQYALERFKNGDNKFSNYKKPDLTAAEPKFKKKKKEEVYSGGLLDELMDRLDTLPSDNLAVEYATNRLIPKEQFKRMYYIDDIQKMENLSVNTRDKFPSHEPRLVLPCFDRRKKLLGCICRSLGTHEKAKRYLTAKVAPEYPLIFGLDQIDYSKEVIVVEGPIDSLFLPNCVAAGGTNLQQMEMFLSKSMCVLVYDYQPRNKELVKIIGKAIERGYVVSLLPEDFPGKDINEAVENGLSPDTIYSIIMDNKYHGAAAKLKLAQWKKV